MDINKILCILLGLAVSGGVVGCGKQADDAVEAQKAQRRKFLKKMEKEVFWWKALGYSDQEIAIIMDYQANAWINRKRRKGAALAKERRDKRKEYARCEQLLNLYNKALLSSKDPMSLFFLLPIIIYYKQKMKRNTTPDSHRQLREYFEKDFFTLTGQHVRPSRPNNTTKFSVPTKVWDLPCILPIEPGFEKRGVFITPRPECKIADLVGCTIPSQQPTELIFEPLIEPILNLESSGVFISILNAIT